ncbi:Uncharacterized conserved protein YbbK, DUF523 family [Humidesulfovibrio mexicanus]|uniref:Uncharacterized conserved protein YbbK, DUF523 family n=1 Tax=Humidesulfovibrio mexicanus TaxID=147047 RepID=A0A238ZIE4_9BACT|nr:DUF523 domain-containing protein [Humidesulfovibrio mexicanus]SNR82474.1 Uncharacterized conserved protein YbbK, DUF523 family [Humidesulfovibrio mexicanus]
MTEHTDLGAPVLVSACLAGYPCRYDGSAFPCPAVVRMVEQGRAVPVCPEQLGGLPTPRAPMELRNGRVVANSGADCTEAFSLGARKGLEVARAHGCVRAILKSRSPSCGSGFVYDGAFSGRLVPGDGVFAALLKEQGFAVTTEAENQEQGG